ncbi:MAG: hypothetical protein JNM68_02685 [Dinghuibacter sp.]|nr:hypothetical protein [Dinghuibacter sp.]
MGVKLYQLTIIIITQRAFGKTPAGSRALKNTEKVVLTQRDKPGNFKSVSKQATPIEMISLVILFFGRTDHPVEKPAHNRQNNPKKMSLKKQVGVHFKIYRMVVQPMNSKQSVTDVKDVIHQVVIDGRFIDDFAAKPKEVTHQLGLPVAKETQAMLKAHTTKSDMAGTLGHKVSAAPAAVGVALVVIVAIVILVLPAPTGGGRAEMAVSDPNEQAKD